MVIVVFIAIHSGSIMHLMVGECPVFYSSQLEVHLMIGMVQTPEKTNKNKTKQNKKITKVLIAGYHQLVFF